MYMLFIVKFGKLTILFQFIMANIELDIQIIWKYIMFQDYSPVIINIPSSDKPLATNMCRSYT